MMTSVASLEQAVVPGHSQRLDFEALPCQITLPLCRLSLSLAFSDQSFSRVLSQVDS